MLFHCSDKVSFFAGSCSITNYTWLFKEAWGSNKCALNQSTYRNQTYILIPLVCFKMISYNLLKSNHFHWEWFLRCVCYMIILPGGMLSNIFKNALKMIKKSESKSKCFMVMWFGKKGPVYILCKFILILMQHKWIRSFIYLYYIQYSIFLSSI